MPYQSAFITTLTVRAWVLGLAQVLFAYLFFSQLATAETNVMWRYTVKPGDNLIHIARAHLVNPADWRVVQTLNHINNPYRVPIGTVLEVPVHLVKQLPASAEVIAVAGQVLVDCPRGASGVQAYVGLRLVSGCSLLTQEKSTTVLRFADDTNTTLHPNSRMVLDTLSVYSGGVMVDTQLRLQQGQTLLNANPRHDSGSRLHVITPSAIAAVRGTQFRVSADNNQTTQETLQGSVAVIARDHEVSVGEGFGTLAKHGQSPHAPVPILPPPDLSSLPKLVTHYPIQFSIPASTASAVAWFAKVVADHQPIQVESELSTTKPEFNFVELANGHYQLIVSALDELGIKGYEATHRFSVKATPLAPSLLEPISNKVLLSNQPVFRWELNPDASAYLFELAKDAEFQHLVASVTLKTDTLQLDQPLTNGAYYWRVASVKTQSEATEQGPFSPSQHFYVNPMSGKPLLQPSNVKVMQNRVYLTLPQAPDGYAYQAVLDNDYNAQKNVWVGNQLGAHFDFPLKEYGRQTLYLRYQNANGDVGEASIYEFNAFPQ